jgi:hypothetical protein
MRHLAAYAGQTAPEPWIQTPEFLKDRAVRVHAGLLNVNDEISRLAAAHRLDPNGTRWKAWKRVLDAWGKWYGESDGSTWLWSGTAATLDHYEQEIASWQAWLRQVYPDVATQLAPPPTQYNPNGQPKSAGVPWWGWALGGVAAAGLTVAILKK